MLEMYFNLVKQILSQSNFINFITAKTLNLFLLNENCDINIKIVFNKIVIASLIIYIYIYISLLCL